MSAISGLQCWTAGGTRASCCPAPSSAPPLAVTDSATFVMVSEAGGAGASAEIVLQQVAGELDRVNFGPCV